MPINFTAFKLLKRQPNGCLTGFNSDIVDVKSYTPGFYDGRFIARPTSNVNIVFTLDQFFADMMMSKFER